MLSHQFPKIAKHKHEKWGIYYIFSHKFNSQKPRFMNVHDIIAGAGIPKDMVLDHCWTIGAPNTLDMDVLNLLNIPGDRLDLWIINSTTERTHEETDQAWLNPWVFPTSSAFHHQEHRTWRVSLQRQESWKLISQNSRLLQGRWFRNSNVDPNNQGLKCRHSPNQGSHSFSLRRSQHPHFECSNHRFPIDQEKMRP